MKLVVDTNIIISALIKKSLTLDILFDDRIELYAPQFLLTEIEKYNRYIIQKSGMDESEYAQILEILIRRINFLSDAEVGLFIRDAAKLTTDTKDIVYLAAALNKKIPIWTNDKGFKGQNIVKIYNTEELRKHL